MMGDDLSVMIALARQYLPGENLESISEEQLQDVLATAWMLDEFHHVRMKTAVNNAVAATFKG